MKTTKITKNQIEKQQNRHSFVPIHCYGDSIDLVDGEIGSIFEFSECQPKLIFGSLFEIPAKRIERIIVK